MNHELFMRRAHELARLGMGAVSPNPMVGCVIVHDGRIIGEGYHRACGGPHAEVHAIGSVQDPSLLKTSTVYVSLEPCAHHGRTPPCVSLLISHKVGRVVVSNTDPNPLVAGKGLARLRQSGIAVETGVLENEGLHINRRFYTFHQKQRPHIILKWAQTTDGFIARADHTSKWISGTWSRKLVHKWRSEEDAVLVGRRTAEVDDPVLTTRSWQGKNPLRLVLDPGLRLSPQIRLFDGEAPTVCYTTQPGRGVGEASCVQLQSEGLLQGMLADLHRRSTLSVIVEGGSATIQSFIDAGLWDEARVFTAPVLFGEGIPAPKIKQAVVDAVEDIEDDRLTILRHEH